MANEEIDEIIVTSEELKNLFKDNILQDRNEGWFYKDTQIDIIALHKQEPKLIYDIANAPKYKIKRKEKRY
ncbi:MAG: hypothetical protein K8R39_08210 [Arcobacteraceae bacterium]|nr:hypothetical protein [Arcobacteraceae bacterium]